MSTLSIPRPRVSPTSDVDARFDALVRTAAPAPRVARTDVDFDTVFDLDTVFDFDYVHPTLVQVPAVRAPRARSRVRRVRPVAVQPGKTTPRHVRMTRRGRMIAVLVFLAVVMGVMTALGGWATATLSGGTPEPVRVIEVAPGDTLYDIAADLAAPGEIRTMVHRIQELNSLPGGQINVGQKLAVPRG